MFSQIILGFIIVGLGATIVYFANNISDIFGSINFAEKYFGGTRNGILFVGFIIMIIGFTIMFGIFTPSTSNIGNLQYQ